MSEVPPTEGAWEVPEAYRAAAEEVRAHLVTIRGGAPFLSSADARLLVGWLDSGVAVSSILRAIERAADARRKHRSRLPLSLGRARVHLGKPGARPQPKGIDPLPGDHPYAGVASEVRDRGQAALADALLALPESDPEELIRAALGLVRDFLERRWDELGDGRERLLAEAREELEELELPEPELIRASEELARDGIRKSWSVLDASVLWTLAHNL